MVEWDPSIPRIFFTDANRVKQILLNLVSNAFKFTTQGSVTIRAKRIKSSGIALAARLEVVDTGTGISKQGLNNLFQEFGKVQENGHLNPQGIGLGLVISKLLSHELGDGGNGGLMVESQEGKGTTFYFVLASKVEAVVKKENTYITGDMELSSDEDEERNRPEGLLLKLQDQHFRLIIPTIKEPGHEGFSKTPDERYREHEQAI